MNTVSSFRAVTPPPPTELASWYMPGHVDGFGDRLLMFDNSAADSLELLRFHAALSEAPGFEDVLRQRVLQLRRFSHDAFPAVRTVERLEADGTLALISTHAPGKRLSSFFTDSRLRNGLNPAFVTWVLGRAIQPLSILQSESDNMAHGVLTADRLILAPGGRLKIAEYVLGSALEQLRLPASRLWSDFGLVTPPVANGAPKLDAKADVFQLAVLALSMLLSRRVTPSDLNGRIAVLLDECSELALMQSPRSGDPLRLWLERALQLGCQPYESARDALVDLRELPSHSEARALEYLRSPNTSGLVNVKSLSMPQLTAQPSEQEAQMATGALLDDTGFPGSALPQAPPSKAPDLPVSDSVEAFPLESVSEVRSPRIAPFVDIRFSAHDEARSSGNEMASPAAAMQKRRSVATWVAVALGLIALAEAGAIAMLWKPSSSTINGRAVDVSTRPGGSGASAAAASVATIAAEQTSAGETATASLNPTVGASPDNAAALALAASRQRSGGVRLVTPVELKVLQGERVLGSSADGPIVTTAGVHQLDLINAALGYRARYTVTFKAGEITALTINVPSGRLSANAQPWAGVWVDGRALGETPLANIEIPIGEHEVVFRHPQLGERRQTVIVRADIPTRVSTTFEGDVAAR